MRAGVFVAIALWAPFTCNKRLALIDVEDTPDAGTSATAAVPAASTAGLVVTVDAGTAATAGTKPAAVTTTQPTSQPGGSFPPTCAGTCEKSLRCLGSFNATEQASCVAQCQAGKPDPARFARLNKMDCATLLATLKGGGGSSTSSGGAAPDEPCGKDHCTTCVWDGTSCYSRVPPFLACDACCCRKGGPAPRWD